MKGCLSQLPASITEFLDADHCTKTKMLTPTASFQGQFSDKNQRKKHEIILFWNALKKVSA